MQSAPLPEAPSRLQGTRRFGVFETPAHGSGDDQGGILPFLLRINAGMVAKGFSVPVSDWNRYLNRKVCAEVLPPVRESVWLCRFFKGLYNLFGNTEIAEITHGCRIA